MGGFAFKLYGKGERSGKTVQSCGDAFGGKIDIRVQGLQVPQAFVITAAAGGAEQVHVFSVRSLLSIKVWMMRGAVECIILRQYRIILSADTASEVRQMPSQKRR